MKTILAALFLCFLALPVRADDKALEASLAYYDHCVKTEWTQRSENARQIYCSCAAEKARGALTADQIKALAGDNPENVLTEKKVLVDIMAPCLSAPLSEIEFETCRTDDKYNNFFQTQPAKDSMCACLGDTVSTYLKTYGGDMMDYILARYPDAENPVDMLQKDFSYRKEIDKKRADCMNKFLDR